MRKGPKVIPRCFSKPPFGFRPCHGCVNVILNMGSKHEHNAHHSYLHNCCGNPIFTLLRSLRVVSFHWPFVISHADVTSSTELKEGLGYPLTFSAKTKGLFISISKISSLLKILPCVSTFITFATLKSFK